MAFIKLNKLENLYIGYLYYHDDFKPNGEPTFKESTNKYLFEKVEGKGQTKYREYFSKTPIRTTEEMRHTKRNLSPTIIALKPFKEYFPDIVGSDTLTLLLLMDELNTERIKRLTRR